MEHRASLQAALLPRLGSLALGSLVGICAVVATVGLGEPTKKKLLFLALSPALPLLMAVTRHPKAVLLFFWVLTLPYNRMYYSFDAIFGNNHSQGPYWIPSDVFLAGLLGLWLYELIILKRSPRPSGRSLVVWGIPFAIAGLASALFAERPAWAFFELARMLKVSVVLVYLRYNMGPIEWWTCAGAMAAGVLFQSILAVMQMALRSVSGVLSMFGGGQVAVDPSAQELGLAAMGGWIRAVGTIGHPSNLACFLLIPIPLLLALGLTARPPVFRIGCLLCGLAGLVGLACTLSRWPWALASAQILVLIAGLTVMRFMTAQRALGIGVVGLFLATVMLLPLSNRIYERMTRDLGASLDHRAKDRRVAMEIFSLSPIVGVGLNNYAVHVLKYDPEMEWALSNEDVVRTTMNVRAFAALHNFYLFLLAESGILGLTAILFFFFGAVRAGFIAVRSSLGTFKPACLGLLLGILGVLAQGFVDFSLWVDPILYSFALAIAMLAAAPALSREASATRPAEVPA